MRDGDAAHKPIPGQARVIYQFRYHEDVSPGTVTYRDYNFKKPDQNLQAGADAELDTHLEDYDYPDRNDDPDLGKTRTQVHLEALQTLRKRGAGESDCVCCQPGYQFTLASYAWTH